MKVRELYPGVITEDMAYEFKAVLNPDHPFKWAKALAAFAHGSGRAVKALVTVQCRERSD